MKIYNLNRNEKGITLIELLASIVILSIVIIGFFSFFPQSILLSTKVEDKLVGLNVAEEVLNEYKETNSWKDVVSVNNKQYYTNIVYIYEQSVFNLTPIRIEIYTNDTFSTSTFITSIYSYVEEGE